MRGIECCGNRKGAKQFLLNLIYKVFSGQQHVSFPWKSIWRAFVPSKVAFFTWTATFGKILTTKNLRKRGMVVMEWCFMCKKNDESIDHLLSHCEVARELWAGVLSRAGLSWVMPMRVVDLLACWNSRHRSSQLAAAWRMISLCIMWCLWLERNERCFNDKEQTVEDIWKLFVFFAAVVLGYCP